MANTIQRISLLWRTFTPIETKVLDLVRETIPDDRKCLFDAQRRRIHKVQRLLDWTEISFYPICFFGKPQWNAKLKFPGFPDHSAIRIAEIRFSISGIKFKTTVWAVSGYVFQLITRPSIKGFCFQPMERVIDLKPLCNFNAPKDESTVGIAVLPMSYQNYVNGGKPMDVNDWQVLRPDEVYRVEFSAGDFLVLAVRQGGDSYLVTKEDEPERTIYFVTTDAPCPHRQERPFPELLQETGSLASG